MRYEAKHGKQVKIRYAAPYVLLFFLLLLIGISGCSDKLSPGPEILNDVSVLVPEVFGYKAVLEKYETENVARLFPGIPEEHFEEYGLNRYYGVKCRITEVEIGIEYSAGRMSGADRKPDFRYPVKGEGKIVFVPGTGKEKDRFSINLSWQSVNCSTGKVADDGFVRMDRDIELFDPRLVTDPFFLTASVFVKENFGISDDVEQQAVEYVRAFFTEIGNVTVFFSTVPAQETQAVISFRRSVEGIEKIGGRKILIADGGVRILCRKTDSDDWQIYAVEPFS